MSATELARRLGDYLARVRYRRESFLVERNGKPIARLVSATPPDVVTLGRALSAWCGAGAADPGFADDLEKIGEADAPPVNPWAS